MSGSNTTWSRVWYAHKARIQGVDIPARTFDARVFYIHRSLSLSLSLSIDASCRTRCCYVDSNTGVSDSLASDGTCAYITSKPASVLLAGPAGPAGRRFLGCAATAVGGRGRQQQPVVAARSLHRRQKHGLNSHNHRKRMIPNPKKTNESHPNSFHRSDMSRSLRISRYTT